MISTMVEDRTIVHTQTLVSTATAIETEVKTEVKTVEVSETALASCISQVCA